VVHVGSGDHGFEGGGGVFGGEFDFRAGVSGHSWEMGGEKKRGGKWIGCKDVRARCFSQTVSRSTSMPKPFRTQSRQRDHAKLEAVLSKQPLSCWANPGVVEG